MIFCTVSGLNKSYGDFSLKDVTFSLPEGCITGFIGVNGAGKNNNAADAFRSDEQAIRQNSVFRS